jgi:hypothetical protein
MCQHGTCWFNEINNNIDIYNDINYIYIINAITFLNHKIN